MKFGSAWPPIALKDGWSYRRNSALTIFAKKYRSNKVTAILWSHRFDDRLYPQLTHPKQHRRLPFAPPMVQDSLILNSVLPET